LSLLVQKWAQFNEFCQRMQDLNTLLDQRALKLQAAIQRLEREVGERRAAEARFSAAFRASPCAMAILSIEDGRVLDANDPFFTLLCQHPHSILGRSLDAYPALDEAASRACARALMPERRNADSIECDFQVAEGDIRRVLLSAETMDLPGGAYVLLTLVDLTKIRRLEKQVEIVREVYRLDDLVLGVSRTADPCNPAA
jgi:PAS domain S-box-containing protein